MRASQRSVYHGLSRKAPGVVRPMVQDKASSYFGNKWVDRLWEEIVYLSLGEGRRNHRTNFVDQDRVNYLGKPYKFSIFFFYNPIFKKSFERNIYEKRVCIMWEKKSNKNEVTHCKLQYPFKWFFDYSKNFTEKWKIPGGGRIQEFSLLENSLYLYRISLIGFRKWIEAMVIFGGVSTIW